jgi:hypothetical protein|tara:strand:+ start:5652 stop:5876 length:225 start_codon:yes stop_codon:yes gene_type:complete
MLKEKIPYYLVILESPETPDKLKEDVRNVLISMAELIDSIQTNPLFGGLPFVEEEGDATEAYVNQDPDLKRSKG